MKRIKVAAFFLGILVLVLGLSCGVVAQKTKVIRLTTDESAPASVKAFEEIANEFEATHPGVKIEVDIVPPLGYGENLLLQIAQGNPPSMAMLELYEVPELQAEGFLVPVDDVIDAIGLEEFNPQGLVEIEGHQWFTPYSADSFFLWIRTDLMRKHGVVAPDNWEGWLEYSKKTSLDTDGDGSVDVYGTVFPLGKSEMLQALTSMLFWETGHSVFDKDFNFQFKGPDAAKVLNFVKEIAQYGPPGAGEYSWWETVDSICSGRVASGPYCGRILGASYDANPDLHRYLEAVPFPKGPALRAVRANHQGYILCKGAPYVEEAKEFLQFLTSGERAVKFCLTVPGHIIPPARSLGKHPAFMENSLLKAHPETARILLNPWDYAHQIMPAREAGAIVDGKVGVGLLNPYNFVFEKELPLAMAVQKVVLQGESVEETLEWVVKEVDRIIAEVK